MSESAKIRGDGVGKLWSAAAERSSDAALDAPEARGGIEEAQTSSLRGRQAPRLPHPQTPCKMRVVRTAGTAVLRKTRGMASESRA
jgi:hypothetical protein